jgi:hypothetical protein
MDQNVRYVLCWIFDGKVARCGHRHSTIAEAATCIGMAGTFIRAISHGRERALTDNEVRVFREYLKRK